MMVVVMTVMMTIMNAETRFTTMIVSMRMTTMSMVL